MNRADGVDGRDQPAGCQRCGNSLSIRLAVYVGSRVSNSLRYAYGSRPLMRADWIRLIPAVARWPACRLPANNQLIFPMAMGRIWFSIQLLSAGSYGSSTKRVNAAQLLRM